MHERVVGIVDGSDAGRDDLTDQRLVLQGVEIAGGGITARGLPALDHGAGLVVEPAIRLGVEAEPGQTALHVAALAPIQPDLVFGGLVCFLGKGRGVDGCRQIAGGGRRAVLQRGDAGERQ